MFKVGGGGLSRFRIGRDPSGIWSSRVSCPFERTSSLKGLLRAALFFGGTGVLDLVQFPAHPVSGVGDRLARPGRDLMHLLVEGIAL